MKKVISARLAAVQIFLIFILPVVLLYLNIIHGSWRIFMLSISALLIYGIMNREKWTYNDIGLQLGNFNKYIPQYSIFTAVGIALLFFLAQFAEVDAGASSTGVLQKFLLFIPISFFQEFAFRAFLMPRLRLITKNTPLVIITNAAIFAFMHAIYPLPSIMIPLAFLGGIYFAWIYNRLPDLVLISISHALLNIVAIMLGFFVF